MVPVSRRRAPFCWRKRDVAAAATAAAFLRRSGRRRGADRGVPADAVLPRICARSDARAWRTAPAATISVPIPLPRRCSSVVKRRRGDGSRTPRSMASKTTQRARKKTQKNDTGNTASAKDAFVDVAASARDVLCAARGGRGERRRRASRDRPGRRSRRSARPKHETRHELRDKAHAYCAAADYADAEAHQEEADAVPEAYLRGKAAVAGTVGVERRVDEREGASNSGAKHRHDTQVVAGTVRRCAKLLRRSRTSSTNQARARPRTTRAGPRRRRRTATTSPSTIRRRDTCPRASSTSEPRSTTSSRPCRRRRRKRTRLARERAGARRQAPPGRRRLRVVARGPAPGPRGRGGGGLPRAVPDAVPPRRGAAEAVRQGVQGRRRRRARWKERPGRRPTRSR